MAVRQALLVSRAVLHLSGPDSLKLLQGLVTKDMDVLKEPGAMPLYTAMLNNKGRFMYDLVCHPSPAPDGGHALFIDCPEHGLQSLRNLLTRFKLRSALTISDASEDMAVVARWHDLEEHALAPQQAGLSTPELPADPRLTELGARGPVLRDSDTASAGSGQGIQMQHEGSYRRHRYTLGIAEGVEEIPSGTGIPLEYNLDWLHGVSFDKGCYLGQELIARTHFRGMVRKRLVPFRLRGSNPATAIGAAVLRKDNKRTAVGSVRGVEWNVGVAHLRLADLQQNNPASFFIDGCEDDVQLEPYIPTWWPDVNEVEGS